MLLFGCAKEKQSIQPRPDSTVITETVESFDSNPDPMVSEFLFKERINIDSLLQSPDNSYSARFDNGTLSLCCYDLLDITNNLPWKGFERTTEEYKVDEATIIVEAYSNRDSFYKTLYNAHPEVRKSELVCGQIGNEGIVLDKGVRIGMTKAELLTRIFNQSEMLDKVDTLNVYEDEMSEAWTTYVFNGDVLAEIRFDSYNDWVERRVRKGK